jgi:energy-coupling factor transporter ATP-binding protein EcfA2
MVLSVELGEDAQQVPVSIPVGAESGKHTLVLGATGSGKTVSAAWLAARLIESGHGAVVIDPKGDRMLREQLSAAAQRRGAEFLAWTPEGPLAYNPYANGSETEIADKALSGETFTEPHYLRQAQRYLGHAVRAMQAAGSWGGPEGATSHDRLASLTRSPVVPPGQSCVRCAHIRQQGTRAPHSSRMSHR